MTFKFSSAGVAVAALILLGGAWVALNPTSYKAVDDSQLGDLIIRMNSLKKGQPSEVYVNDRKLIVVLLNEDQEADLRIISDHVWQPNTPGCEEDLSLCLFWANLDVNDGDEVIHMHKKPGVTSKNRQWLGGYLSLMNDVSYDYAGRAISTAEYSLHKSQPEADNLGSPDYAIAGELLIINPR